MVISHSPNYLFSNKVNNIDNHTLVKDCLDIEKMLLTTFTNIDRKGYGCLSTAHHEKYNMLTFSTKEIQDLYYELQNLISPYLENKTYLIKSWLNVFRKEENINWHSHWEPEKKVWHGFYCVQVGESYTEYKIPGIEKIIKIKSQEGLIVFGKSENCLYFINIIDFFCSVKF